MNEKYTVWIYSVILTSLVVCTLVSCHDGNVKILQELQGDIVEIGEEHENIKHIIQILGDSLLEAETAEVGEEESDDENVELDPREKEIVSLKAKDFIDRLDTLQINIEAIDSYVHGERNTDNFLRSLSGEIAQAFDDTMQEVKQLADGLRTELNGSFVNIDQKLTDVEEFANSRNVIVGGILYYDGIGSACGSDFDVCRVENSECRDGKCQCMPGLSHDGLQQSCVDWCEHGYGSTYQTVYNYIIRGHNNLTMIETSLEECRNRCEFDDAFHCRSFDYFPRWKKCYLSEHTKSDAEKEWEYNEAGIHFQRDCVIDSNTK